MDFCLTLLIITILDNMENICRILLFIICFIATIYVMPLVIYIGFYAIIAYVLYKIIWRLTDSDD